MARNRNTPKARTRANAGRPATGSAGSRAAGAKRTSPTGTGKNQSAKAGTRRPSPGRGSGPKVARGLTNGKQPALTTSRARRRLERASAPVLIRLNRAPRWVPTAVMLVLLLIGLFTPGSVSAALLAAVALILAWLLALAWPTLAAQGRFARILVIGLVLFSALVRLSGLNVVRKH